GRRRRQGAAPARVIRLQERQDVAKPPARPRCRARHETSGVGRRGHRAFPANSNLSPARRVAHELVSDLARQGTDSSVPEAPAPSPQPFPLGRRMSVARRTREGRSSGTPQSVLLLIASQSIFARRLAAISEPV